MNRAFSEMLGGRRGPVAVSLPMDVQAEAAEVELNVSQPETAGRSAADQQAVARAAELMLSAQRPLILAGGGVLMAEASEVLQALAEHLGAAVITTFAGKGCFPEITPSTAGMPGPRAPPAATPSPVPPTCCWPSAAASLTRPPLPSDRA